MHGIKTVEVRSWITAKTGPILIHASKSPEADPEPWTQISTPELKATAGLVGGVIGVATLVECITYTSREAYAADVRHCTTAERFRPPRLYGFRFEKAQRVQFVPWLGNTNFFTVGAEIAVIRKPRMKRLLPTRGLVVRLPEEGPR